MQFSFNRLILRIRFSKRCNLAVYVALSVALLGSVLQASAQEKADTAGWRKFRFGGYGEMVAAFKDYGINRFQSSGSQREYRASIAVPRATLGLDYKFTPKWILGMEIEFEALGTGTAYEIENTENGEYETEIEKGGEVAIEQLHVSRLIIPEFNVRAGHMVVPVGLVNSHHEPINFFGTVRPESETSLIPSTWHETGIEIFGTFGSRAAVFDYSVMAVTGLNANGIDRNTWAASGKQGIFETDNFTSPAYIGRLDWRGIQGLRTGVSVYYCHNTGANADKSQTYKSLGRIPVSIFTWDAQYRNRWLTARANLTYGHIGNTEALNTKNGSLSGKSPYSRLTPVAKNALSYGAEIGFSLRGIIGSEKCPALYPYARYEYWNPQRRVVKPWSPDPRLEVSKWSVGLNWFALPNLVVKADYSMRQIGTSRVFGKGSYNSENEFSVGLAYIGWFIKK